MIKGLLIKCIFNTIVFIVSVISFSLVCSYLQMTQDAALPSSPKALVNLQDVFLPPLMNLQLFVFIFDLLVLLYYIYQWPCWDHIKKRFVYYQYEAQPVEKQDCSNLFLKIVFIVLSKGLALGILIFLLAMAHSSIQDTYNEYQFNSSDQDELKILQEANKKGLTIIVFDTLLGCLLIISFVINCCTLDNNNNDNQKKSKKNRNDYGQIHEEND